MGNKYWFAKFPSKSDGTKTSISRNTTAGAWSFLSKAADWYNSVTKTPHNGVETASKLLSSNIELDDNNISAWTRKSTNLTGSEISRSITSYPKSFWYTIQTKQSNRNDGTMGSVNNPLGNTNLIHPFKNFGWDIYITKVIVITDIQGFATNNGTYSIGFTSNNTSHSDEVSGSHGKIDTTLAANSVQVIIPNSIGHNAVLNPWKTTHNLGLAPSAAADVQNWKGKIYLECFCPELDAHGLSEFGDDPSEGAIMKDYS